MTAYPPLSETDTIIFDLGQVIIDLDGSSVIRQLQSLSRHRQADYKELIVSSPLLMDYETGKISDDVFRRGMINLLGLDIGFDAFDEIWNGMLLNIPSERLHLMVALKDKFRTMILSNTNRIHEVRFDEMTAERMPGNKMKDMVHHAYYSHDIGYRKPDPEVYNMLIDRHSLKPERTIFLDDRKENITAARQVGIAGVQVDYPDQIFDILGGHVAE